MSRLRIETAAAMSSSRTGIGMPMPRYKRDAVLLEIGGAQEVGRHLLDVAGEHERGRVALGDAPLVARLLVLYWVPRQDTKPWAPARKTRVPTPMVRR